MSEVDSGSELDVARISYSQGLRIFRRESACWSCWWERGAGQQQSEVEHGGDHLLMEKFSEGMS
jgi:hypothetical protein